MHLEHPRHIDDCDHDPFDIAGLASKSWIEELAERLGERDRYLTRHLDCLLPHEKADLRRLLTVRGLCLVTDEKTDGEYTNVRRIPDTEPMCVGCGNHIDRCTCPCEACGLANHRCVCGGSR